MCGAVPEIPSPCEARGAWLPSADAEVFGLPSNNFEEKRIDSCSVQGGTKVKALLAKSPVVISGSAVLVCRWRLILFLLQQTNMKNYKKTSATSP